MLYRRYELSSAFHIVTGLLEMLSRHGFEKVGSQRKREGKKEKETKERRKDEKTKVSSYTV